MKMTRHCLHLCCINIVLHTKHDMQTFPVADIVVHVESVVYFTSIKCAAAYPAILFSVLPHLCIVTSLRTQKVQVLVS